jgi:hypothetical protein
MAFSPEGRSHVDLNTSNYQTTVFNPDLPMLFAVAVNGNMHGPRYTEADATAAGVTMEANHWPNAAVAL